MNRILYKSYLKGERYTHRVYYCPNFTLSAQLLQQQNKNSASLPELLPVTVSSWAWRRTVPIRSVTTVTTSLWGPGLNAWTLCSHADRYDNYQQVSRRKGEKQVKLSHPPQNRIFPPKSPLSYHLKLELLGRRKGQDFPLRKQSYLLGSTEESPMTGLNVVLGAISSKLDTAAYVGENWKLPNCAAFSLRPELGRGYQDRVSVSSKDSLPSPSPSYSHSHSHQWKVG